MNTQRMTEQNRPSVRDIRAAAERLAEAQKLYPEELEQFQAISSKNVLAATKERMLTHNWNLSKNRPTRSGDDFALQVISDLLDAKNH